MSDADTGLRMDVGECKSEANMLARLIEARDRSRTHERGMRDADAEADRVMVELREYLVEEKDG